MSFFTEEKNSTLIASAEGDFELGIDVFPFNVDEGMLFEPLGLGAAERIRLAVPNKGCDEPAPFLLWEDGICRSVMID